MDQSKAERGNSPPKYEETDATLPTYESIYGKVKQAQEESSGNADFAQRMVAMTCCGTVCTVISLLISFTIPIANLVIGIVYLDDCPIEKYIPIFLLVAGVFGILKGLCQLGFTIRQKVKKEEVEEDDDPKKARPNAIDSLINCFLFAWFIAGSVWVYSINGDVEYSDKDSNDYCHEVCYKYAFWFLTVTYIFMALGLLCCCGGILFVCCVVCKKKDQNNPA